MDHDDDFINLTSEKFQGILSRPKLPNIFGVTAVFTRGIKWRAFNILVSIPSNAFAFQSRK